ncbi:hypothetical protein CLV63_11771 [Murinocardiopsis flavida]|uniref:LppX_LprAFG lipoprotein n=1 Tax=Murinocardiopsis flavida TaxID=645275 RepID=A0A2P8D6M9_9ACTN|nr:DUF6612 family protein [Murinocardiopsis flavida]PSK92862.1 hypothetical protein CLV63_11771 [Murinocardiopsis flavida]
MLRKITGTLAGVGLALAATGCAAMPGAAGGGGLGGGPSVTEVIDKVVDKTREVETYQAEMSMAGSMGGESMDITSDIEFTAKPEPTYKMSMDMAGQENTVLMRGSEILMEADPAMGGGWMRAGGSGEQAMNQSQDPIAEVEKLLAGDNVEEVGSEDVGGVSTTKYKGSYTIDQALEQIQDTEAKDAARQVYDKAGVDKIDFEAWVGDDQLPRKVTSSAGDTVDTTLTFTSFNEPVDIQYPDPSEVKDMDDMLGGGGGAPDIPDPGGY